MQEKAILRIENKVESEEYVFYFNKKDKITCECGDTKYEFENIKKCSNYLTSRHNNHENSFYLAMLDNEGKCIFVSFTSINKVCEHISYVLRCYHQKKRKNFMIALKEMIVYRYF